MATLLAERTVVISCSSCRHVNRPDVRFCVRCGAKLSRRCAVCGADAAPGERFCGDCGQALHTAPEPSTPGAAPYPLRQGRYEDAVMRRAPALSAVDGPEPDTIRAVSDEDRQGHGTNRPDMCSAPRHAAPDGTVTLLFTDIEDSAVLTEQLGDRRWLGLLRAHNTIVRREIAAHGGYEVKAQGDGFMVAFGSAHRALHCAIAIQRAMARLAQQSPPPLRGGEEPRPHHAPVPHAVREGAARSDNDEEVPWLRVRIGLHTGEMIRESNDFFGRNVVLAARIAAQARGGEILVSALLRDLTTCFGEFSFDEERVIALKGLSGLHRVFRVRESPAC